MLKSYETAPKVSQQQFDQKYKFIEIIGSGTYGNVLRYYDKIKNEDVAIKVLKDKGNLQSLEKQVQLMQMIQHANVLNCLDYFYLISQREFMMVMPYFYKNLKDRLQDIKNQNQINKIWVCLQIARGVNALHQKNIIHRDIKPANILVNQNWDIKICDFGFSREQNTFDMSVKVGTPSYRDPNVSLGKYTKKCDIYSVGLVFDTIFRGESYYQKVQQQNFIREVLYFKENKKKIIQKLSCSEEMKSIILKCLQNQQVNRYSSKQLEYKLQNQWAKLNNKQVQLSFDQLVKEQKKKSNLRKLSNCFKENQVKINQEKNIEEMRKTVNGDFYQKGVTQQKQRILSEFNIIQSEFIVHQTPKAKKMTKAHTSLTSPTLKSMDSSKSISSLHFYEKLLKFDMEILSKIRKNANFKTIYQYFDQNRQKIRGLDKLESISSIPNQDKRLVKFIGLFAYIKYLKDHENLLKKNSQNHKIRDIPLTQISQKTIQICLDLIQKQLIISLHAIKPYLTEINISKNLYRNNQISQNVLKMIDEGVMKKFTRITDNFKQSQICQEFKNIVLNKRYHCKNQVEENRKKEYVEIVDGLY